MPLCFGASGLVRARQIAQSARCASDVHTFCPVSRQPPSTRSARVRSEARSEPASGSLNSWHQVISPRSVGATKRSICSGRSVAEDRRDGPAGDDEVGTGDAGAGQLLVDDQLLGRAGAQAVRARPVRREVAGLGQRDPALDSAAPRRSLRPGPAPGARTLVRRRGRCAACAAARRAARSATRRRQRGVPPASARSASARRRYRCASCSQVKPMPPSTWMQSLAVSTAASSAMRAGDRGGERVLGRRAAASAASQATAVADSTRHSISLHRCLIAWKLPIGAPNCSRTLAYSTAVRRHHSATPAASAVSSVDGQLAQAGAGRPDAAATESRPTSTRGRDRSALGWSTSFTPGRVERRPGTSRRCRPGGWPAAAGRRPARRPGRSARARR